MKKRQRAKKAIGREDFWSMLLGVCGEGELLESGIVVFSGESPTSQELWIPENLKNELKSLPKNLTVNGTFEIRFCPKLKSLPEGFNVNHLDIAECINLEHIPEKTKIGISLEIVDCPRLTSIPDHMYIRYLMIEDCPSLVKVPRRINIQDHLFIDRFVEGMDGWKMVPAGARVGIAVMGREVHFSLLDRSMTKNEFEKIMNVEERRIAVERMGFEWLVKNFKPELVDVDEHNINGHRALLRIKFDRMVGGYRIGMADSYCLLVCGDPSTGRVYYMEVPARTRTCQEADAYLNLGLDQRQQVGRT